ncbi:unnamed protein product [Moneuplotes crassus]|uniref:TRP C-terminal domain-containing protein n=1 Tax=Euplotes crassus TaxID=5936 RepID=A0AAD1XEK7_EUPCR|nr:unnamed protein product [Moneuplotes crassus]
MIAFFCLFLLAKLIAIGVTFLSYLPKASIKARKLDECSIDLQGSLMSCHIGYYKLCFFLFFTGSVICGICRNQPQDITIESYSYSNYDATKFTRAIMGDQGSLYYFGKLTTGANEHALVVKYDSSGTLAFQKVTETVPMPQGFEVSMNETFLFALLGISGSPGGIVVQYSGTTGAINYASVIPITPTLNSILNVDRDGEILIITEPSVSPLLCKICPGKAAQDCTNYSINLSPVGLTGIPRVTFADNISGFSFYFTAVGNTQPSNFYITRVKSDSTVDKTTKISCPSTSCDYTFSDFVYDEDAALVHAVTQFHSKVLLFKFHETTAVQDGILYATDNSFTCSGPVSIAQSGSNIVISATCTSMYLTIFNTATSSFSTTLKVVDTSLTLFNAFVDSGYLKTVGYWSPNGEHGYIGGYKTGSTTVNSQFESVSSIFVANSSYSIVSATSISISSATSSISPVPITNKDETSVYDKIALNTASVDAQNISSGDSVSVASSCSIVQGTGLTCSLGSYLGQAVPSWVTLEPAGDSCKISESAPSSESPAQFAVDCVFGTLALQTPVSLTFSSSSSGSESECSVSNCKACTTGSSDLCQTCDDGYNLISKGTGCASAQVQATVTASSATLATGFAASMTSPQGAWSMVNQIQVLMLMPLTECYFPADVISFLTSMSFTMFSLNFIPLQSIPGIKETLGYVDHDQTDDYVYEMQIKSGSTFINSFSFICIIGFISIFHLCLYIIKKDVELKVPVEEQGWKAKAVLWLFDLLTLNIYIRLFMEVFLLMILSSLRELYFVYRLSSSNEFISYFLNMPITFVLGAFIAVCIWQWKKSKSPQKFSRQYYFVEFFQGVRNTWKARVYSTLFLTKRLTLVALVTLVEVFPMLAKVIIFIMIQLSCCITIVILRPFDAVRNNIIEIVNEVVFLVCSSLMVHFNTKGRWKSWHEKMYINLILSNICLISLISIIFLLKDISLWIKKTIQKRSVNPKVLKSAFDNSLVPQSRNAFKVQNKSSVFRKSKVESYTSSKSMQDRYKEAIKKEREDFMARNERLGGTKNL